MENKTLPAQTFFENKVVCVTGAGGSIGSELCVNLLCLGIKKLWLVSLTEAGLYNIMRRLRPIADAQKVELVGVLGSVADAPAMHEILEDCDVVIHAAAHKHVPICEENPLAAIANNVMGTYALARVAAIENVGTFVLISTDKAVKPKSVMGATKRMAELILRDMMPHPETDGSKTKFITVRFGNVLESAGSVLPLWREQVKNGGPVTLTDPNCERFFMSIPEACELVLNAATMMFGNTFVFDMGAPQKMSEMLDQLLYSDLGGVHESLEIRVTGLRPGEKLTEELDYGGERLPTDHPKVFRVDEGHLRKLNPKKVFTLFQFVVDRNTEAATQLLWEMVG